METSTKTSLDQALEQRAANQHHVNSIAARINQGVEYEEWEEGFDPEYPNQLMSGFDWLADALDFEYILTSDRKFKSARVLVAFGGPTIWVDFQRKAVDLYWWGDRATAYFDDDAMGIEEALEELFNCQ